MHITDQKHIFGRIYYIWKMEEQVWSPLYSIWAVFLISCYVLYRNCSVRDCIKQKQYRI